ncbi:MAG: beta strand repeat-containing protein, partial [Patescibacteria group bacterium]
MKYRYLILITIILGVLMVGKIAYQQGASLFIPTDSGSGLYPYEDTVSVFIGGSSTSSAEHIFDVWNGNASSTGSYIANQFCLDNTDNCLSNWGAGGNWTVSNNYLTPSTTNFDISISDKSIYDVNNLGAFGDPVQNIHVFNLYATSTNISGYAAEPLIVKSGPTNQATSTIYGSLGNTIKFLEQSNSGALEIIRPTTGSNSTTTIADYLVVNTNSLYVDGASGNVGIGTTGPLAKLNINGGTGTLATGLAFGDGDTGFYEYQDDWLRLQLDGTDRWNFQSGQINGTVDGSAVILNEIASLTNPTLVPARADYDTGIGGDAADALSLITNGASRIYIKSDGNVGIGTTGPGYKLEVVGTMKAATTTVAGILDVQDANGSSKMYVDTTSGNVGIGTTGPAYTLDLSFANANGGNPGLHIKNTDTTVSSAYSGVLLEAQNGIVKADWFAVPTSGSVLSGGGLVFRTQTNHPIAFQVNNQEKVRIDTNGNVGIGTTGPMSQLHLADGTMLIDVANKMGSSNNAPGKLQVNQRIDIGDVDTVGGPAAIYFWTYPTLNSSADGYIKVDDYKLSFGNTNVLGDGYLIGTELSLAGSLKSSAHHVGLYIPMTVNNSGTAGYTAMRLNVTETATGSGTNNLMDLQVGGTSKMVVTNQGNVGIGTTTPEAILEVNKTSGSENAVFLVSSTTSGDLVTITNAGNVGIGTTGPTQKLEVNGNLKVGGNATTTGYLVIGTTNPTVNIPVGGFWAGAATTTNLAVSGLLNCNTIDTDANGNLKCGSDETGVGADYGAAWEAFSLSPAVIKPTTTAAGILVNSASSTITVLNMNTATSTNRLVVGSVNPTTNDLFWVGGNSYFNGNATTTGSFNAGQLLVNNTPISDIYSPLAGSASIITVGTIGTGVWQGTAINPTYLDSSVIISTEIDTSAEIAGIVGDETGSGLLVFDTNPTITGATFDGEAIFTANGRFNLINATSTRIDSATTTQSLYVNGDRV